MAYHGGVAGSPICGRPVIARATRGCAVVTGAGYDLEPEKIAMSLVPFPGTSRAEFHDRSHAGELHDPAGTVPIVAIPIESSRTPNMSGEIDVPRPGKVTTLRRNECERGDLNPHGCLVHRILSPARLPVPPLSRVGLA